MSDIRGITYETARPVTLQTTATADAAGPFVALQATLGAGVANVVTLRGEAVTVYLPLGIIIPLAVLYVVSGATTTATGIIGFCAMPFKSKGM